MDQKEFSPDRYYKMEPDQVLKVQNSSVRNVLGKKSSITDLVHDRPGPSKTKKIPIFFLVVH